MNKTWLSVSILVVLLTGCGGSASDDSSSGGEDSSGSTGASQTGYFLDSAVQGVDFKTASKSGITDQKGAFPYLEGESVTFSIGNLDFPTASATQYITPLELAGTDNVNDPQVINMVRLLMTLDTDSNPDNGISISSQAKEVATPLDFDVPIEQFAASQDVLALVSNGGQDSQVTELVSEVEAQQHFQNTLDDIDAIDTYADFVGMYNANYDPTDPESVNYPAMMNIYPDGSYLFIDFDPDYDPDYPSSGDDFGIEYGDLGLKDGHFNLDIKVDTELVGSAGLSTADWSDVYMDGETLHMTATEHGCDANLEECSAEIAVPRVPISGSTIVGSWETQDGNASYNFRDDGKYFFAQVKDPECDFK